MKSLLIFSLFTFLALSCDTRKNSKEGPAPWEANIKEGEDHGSEDSNTDNKIVSLKLGVAQIGVRNYRQLMRTMSMLTGVPDTRRQVKQTFELLSSNLATHNKVESFNAAHQASSYKIAYAFCIEAYNNKDDHLRLYGKHPDDLQEFNLDAPLHEVASHLLKTLWPSRYQNNTDEYKLILVSLMKDLIVSSQEKRPKERDRSHIKGALLGACTSTLASSPVTLFE